MTTTQVHVGGVEHEIKVFDHCELGPAFIKLNGRVLHRFSNLDEANATASALKDGLALAKPIQKESDVGHEFKSGDRVRYRPDGSLWTVLCVHGRKVFAADETDEAWTHSPADLDLVSDPTPQPSRAAMRAAEEIGEAVREWMGGPSMLWKPNEVARIIDEKMQPAMKVVDAAAEVWSQWDNSESSGAGLPEAMRALGGAIDRLDGEGSDEQ